MFARELSCSRQRRTFGTGTRYVGMGPAAMKEGDIVCVLYGGRAPYVLCPRDDHYGFIGECCTHGIMDGEALKIAGANGVKSNYFELG
jgi:hypothetical protein